MQNVIVQLACYGPCETSHLCNIDLQNIRLLSGGKAGHEKNLIRRVVPVFRF